MSSEAEALRRLLATFEALDLLAAKWVDATSELLKFCAAYRPTPEAWALEAGEPFVTIQDSLIGIEGALRSADNLLTLDGPVSGFASVEARRALSVAVGTLIDALASSGIWSDEAMRVSVAARAAAGAIDSLYGKTFVEHFRGRGEVRLTAGQPFPVLPRNPARYLGAARPTTAPSSLPRRDLAAVDHLRLAPQEGGAIDFVLDFDSWNRLSFVGDGAQLVLGSGQPNLALDEFDVHQSDESMRYTNRGPSEPADQSQHVRGVIDAAGRSGVGVLALPE